MDRISELPECLITQILSYLPIKESMKTSVLATSWKNHWLHVPVLELNCKDLSSEDESVFLSIMDRFLTDSLLQRLKVNLRGVKIQGFMDRIHKVIHHGRIQHLDLEGFNIYRDNHYFHRYNEFMPLNLYSCNTLVCLKLSRFAMNGGSVVRLPCLKLLDLQEIRWVAPMTPEKFLSGCPALEELTFRRDLDPVSEVYNDQAVVMRLRSRSLKRFSVPFKSGYSTVKQKYVLEIDAPELEYMSLQQDHFDTIVVKNLTSLSTIDLDIEFAIEYGGFVIFPPSVSNKNEISDFLSGLTSVSHMIISQKTMMVLDRYSKVGLIPKFSNLSHLEAVFPISLFQFLPVLLESCPNLKHLILKIVYTWETEVFQVINVPRGFVSTLECVEIHGFYDWKGLKIASYFLENSAVLKKLILRLARVPCPRKHQANSSHIYKELDRLTKPNRCQILIDYEA